MKKHRSYILFIYLLFFSISTSEAQQDTLKTKTRKNRFCFELLGDPFSLYLERKVVATENYTMYAGAGVSLLLAILDEPNVSLSLNNCYRLTPGISLFGLFRAQLVSLGFPQVPLDTSPATAGYVAGRNHLGVNTLSFNFGAGPSFRFGRWELSPVYPCYNYALGSFAGEEVHINWYHSVSLNSRVYYHF